MTKYVLILLHSSKKTFGNQVWIRTWPFWLTFEVLHRMTTSFKISQFSRFHLWFWYAIHVKIWKWLKLFHSVPFIKKTLVNHVYIRIWSYWLTFTVYSERQTPKLVNFQDFSSGMWLRSKLDNDQQRPTSVPFIKKTWGNHVYNWIWAFWQTFTVLQWMKKN